MPEQLQVTTVTKGGRIYLGEKAAKVLKVRDGDKIQIVEDHNLIFILKIQAPTIAKAKADCATSG